ncbi:hypothetical protein BJY52DRAFT_170214 [Lactarius psammicola]|nr:hypothetical protein BJY52DRAFT_170214 [Lactarius psammicola]
MRFTRCYGELWMAHAPHVPPSLRFSSYFFFFFPYLATKMSSKTYLCSPLCRFTSPTPTPYPPLCISAPLSLISFPVLSAPRPYSKMFVGGLSWDTTDEGLRNYFSEFGKVDACTIVRDADGKSRGFAFLTFEDPASVNAVMIREHFLDGKAIDPKRAIPREEHLRNTRYFVGGLAPHSTADSMRAFFSKYGKVVDATVMVDRETGRSKGFGFVTFEDNSNDAQLVGKLGLILDDKQIEVKTAQPRSQRDQQRLGHAATTTKQQFQQQPSRGRECYADG